MLPHLTASCLEATLSAKGWWARCKGCGIPLHYFQKQRLVVMAGDFPAVGTLVWQLALRQLLVFMDSEHIVVLRVWKSALRQLLMLTGHGGWTFWCLRGKKQALRQLRTNYPPCHGWQARCRSRVGKGALRLLQVKPITWLKGHCKWLTKLIANKQAVPKGPIPSWMLSPACHSLSKSIAEFVKSKNFTLLVSFSIHQYMHKHKVLTFVFFDKPKLSGRSLPYQWWYLFFVWWFFELMYLLLMPCQFKPFLLLRSYFLHLKS